MTTDRRAPLLPTAHQGVELLLAVGLAYTAVHVPGSDAAVLIAVGLAAAVVGLVGPGALAVRRLLSHRLRRLADLVVAGIAIAACVGFTRSHFVASGALLAAALVLIRLGVSRTPAAAPPRAALADQLSSSAAPPSAPRGMGGKAADLQPLLNRTARAAGVFVRNRRAEHRR